MKDYRFIKPPTPIRSAPLDNLALVPASLLPFKAQWQAVANRLPKGGVLICLPTGESCTNKTLKTVATLLEEKGHPVTLLPAGRLQGYDIIPLSQ